MDLKELEFANKVFIRHPWEEARIHVVSRLLFKCIRIRRRITDGIKILDIGCGDAYAVGCLSNQFPQYAFTALDKNLDGSSLKLLQEKYKYQTNLEIRKSINNIQGPVSLVLLLDVIEHIEEAGVFLSDLKMKPFINEDTIFLITVPAFQELFGNHDLVLGHFRRYNRAILEKLLAVTGFELIETSYFFLLPLLVRYVNNKMKKHYSKKNGVNVHSDITQWEQNQWITKIVKNILIVDFQFSRLLYKMGIRLPGLSLSCICKPIV